ncbi:hypothetical protein E5288_WYG011922 [Bos mutus]|uniref:Uncharacterized protein n=1 Tax=Bos mutus TaxID=72004 RepID=A0A6B0QUV4_9CETA|nr:hypothetical protein [Bos mutus]
MAPLFLFNTDVLKNHSDCPVKGQRRNQDYRKNHTENMHRILAPKDDDPSEQNCFVLLLDKMFKEIKPRIIQKIQQH